MAGTRLCLAPICLSGHESHRGGLHPRAWPADAIRARRQWAEINLKRRAAALSADARFMVRQRGSLSVGDGGDRWCGDQPPAGPAYERILFERIAPETDGALRSASRNFLILCRVRAVAVRRGIRGTDAAPLRKAPFERSGLRARAVDDG